MDRKYLFVPPEERAEVAALGAQWDGTSKCWYIGSEESPEKFSRWLTDEPDDGEFSIISSEAYVASATVPCGNCHCDIEVICIHCHSGVASGEALAEFTVSSVWAMDEMLAKQLEPWPTFRKIDSPHGAETNFANHCPRCGALQEDLYLHSEPDQPFFNIPHAAPGTIKLTPLAGRVQLSGDEHFEIA